MFSTDDKQNQFWADQRKHKRYQMLLKVDLDTSRGRLSDWATNISKGGIFVTTSEQFEIGESVSISFQLPGQSLPVTVCGKVVWRKNSNINVRASNSGIGIAFSDCESQVTVTLDRFLNRLETRWNKDTGTRFLKNHSFIEAPNPITKMLRL